MPKLCFPAQHCLRFSAPSFHSLVNRCVSSLFNSTGGQTRISIVQNRPENGTGSRKRKTTGDLSQESGWRRVLSEALKDEGVQAGGTWVVPQQEQLNILGTRRPQRWARTQRLAECAELP